MWTGASYNNSSTHFFFVEKTDEIRQSTVAILPVGHFSHHHTSAMASDKTIRLAATTSIENSGLLKYLLPKFTAKHSYKFDLKIVGSGKALRLGRTGKIDMVWAVDLPKNISAQN